jgi:hypothetical protein
MMVYEIGADRKKHKLCGVRIAEGNRIFEYSIEYPPHTDLLGET